MLSVADQVLCSLIKAACRNGHLLGGLDNLVDDLLGGLDRRVVEQRRRWPGQRQRRWGPGGLLDDLTGGLTDNLGLGRAPFGELPAADRGRA